MALITEWFKVIQNDHLIGTGTNESFARYSPKSGRIHICDALTGQYIVVDGRYFRDDWMLALDPKSEAEWEPAIVISISKEEYDILSAGETPEQINSKQLINTESEDILKKELKPEKIVTIAFVRERKLKELSAECEKIIESGFDLILSDGVSHHFSLSVYDQMNLATLQNSLSKNEDLVYHADGELMQFYAPEDAEDILIGAKKWKQYNIALYNSLKNWVNSIEDISAIDAIQFDSEVPEEYCTVVLQSLAEGF